MTSSLRSREGTSMKKLVTVVVSLLLAFTACGSDDNPAIEAPGGDESSGEAADGHNDADVAFAQGMIPHHEQAIEMADMVLERGASAEVKALSTRIKEAQAPEIELMRGWLGDWGEETTEEAPHAGMGSSDEPTMMTEAEMDDLEKASGAELDKMFLEMMIRHHEGAIAMAETEVSDGEFPDAVELAKQVMQAQDAEIDEMKRLLAALG